MSEPVTQIVTPTRLEYTVTPGRAQRKFLNGLVDGKILGQRCPKCAKVYVPPRGSCPTCAVPTEEEVRVSDSGTLTTFCIVDLNFYGQEIEVPYVCGSVLLDGADLPFFGLIQDIPVSEVRMGLRVKAVWADPADRKPSFNTIKYFVPTGEPDAEYETYKDHL
jgi:uncharacterized OB-fold protein